MTAYILKYFYGNDTFANELMQPEQHYEMLINSVGKFNAQEDISVTIITLLEK